MTRKGKWSHLPALNLTFTSLAKDTRGLGCSSLDTEVLKSALWWNLFLKRGARGSLDIAIPPPQLSYSQHPAFCLGSALPADGWKGEKCFPLFSPPSVPEETEARTPFLPLCKLCLAPGRRGGSPGSSALRSQPQRASIGMGSQAGRDFCSSLRSANPGNLFPCRELEVEEEIDGEGTPTGTQGEGGVQVPQGNMRRWGGVCDKVQTLMH